MFPRGVWLKIDDESKRFEAIVAYSRLSAKTTFRIRRFFRHKRLAIRCAIPRFSQANSFSTQMILRFHSTATPENGRQTRLQGGNLFNPSRAAVRAAKDRGTQRPSQPKAQKPPPFESLDAGPQRKSIWNFSKKVTPRIG